MGVLAIHFPNQETVFYKGTWHREKLSNLPNNHFFITDFTKEEMYYFVIEKTIDSIPTELLTKNPTSDVFIVDGRYYLNGLQYFIDGFEANQIEKAIYSRIKWVEKELDNPTEIIHRLVQKYGNEALVYLASDEQFGTWVGATPEILISGNSNELFTMALAGTKPTETDNWTTKEEDEHQYVIDFIKEKIEEQNPEKLSILPTKTVKAGAVFHLRTDFHFSLPESKWNTLMENLHPTPAVCGTPADLAKEYILTYEPHERKFYTGLIGWRGKDDIKVFVNLRCMQVLEGGFALYVGGGITKDSDIGKEWNETEAKSETLMGGIELES